MSKRVFKDVLIFMLVAALVLLFMPSLAFAGSGPVTNSDTGNSYTTIQDAIDAAESGNTIEVAAGTYVEVGQIVIDKDLTIIGEDKATTIIKPNQDTGGAGDDRGWFLVKAGNEFNLSNVTLDGEGKNVHQAIRSYGSGTIDNNIIKNIKYSKYIGLGMVGMDGSAMTFSNNDFSNIERIGMMAFGTGTSAKITGNTYTGKGPGDYLDYGVEIGGGAKATISRNTITGCGPSDTAWASAGISVNSLYAEGSEVSEAVITENTLTNNQSGIIVGYDDNAPDKAKVNFNKISNNSNYGVRSSTENPIDATHNWWGHCSGPSGEGSGSGDAVSENVLFDPWYLDSEGSAISSEGFKITAVQKFGGTITPAGDIFVPCGGSQTFTISATPHTYISDVRVDGVSVGPVTSYTFTDVHANHTISPYYMPTQAAIDAANWAAGVEVAGITEETVGVAGITEGNVADFVTMLYNQILDREPDPDGLSGWVQVLEDGDMNAEELASAFIFSDECQEEIGDYSNSQFVTFLYGALLGREADETGLADWLAAMEDGMSQEEVIEGFCHCQEWEDICSGFGVEAN